MEVTIVDSSGQRRSAEAQPTDSLLDVLRRAEVPVVAPCGGNGSCGKCEVAVQTTEGLSRVLACQTAPQPDMTVYPDAVSGIHVDEDADRDIASEYVLDDASPDEMGVAVDVGTTTIAAYLYNLKSGHLLARSGAANPQASFGADVISRIQACEQGNLEIMGQRAVARIHLLADQMCAMAGADVRRISRWALAGNTTMEHIICGLSPESIGVAPFTPVSLFGSARAVEGLSADTYVAPCISGYVGGDIVAGLLACGLDRTDETVLFADLGTNGELALAAGGKLYCCATATGPAFEGSNISMGMQARAGAIDSCRVESGRFAITAIDDAKPIGICGSGLIDVLATCLEAGLIDETGRLLYGEELPADVRPLVGEVDGQRAALLVPDGSVVLTQKDIRALQLAKAAVYAGLETLLEGRGLQMDDVDKLVIGGAFGTHMNARSAARAGIFPSELLPVTHMVGNCAGRGVSQALLSQQARDRQSEIAHSAEYTELSCSETFADAYIESMMFEGE